MMTAMLQLLDEAPSALAVTCSVFWVLMSSGQDRRSLENLQADRQGPKPWSCSVVEHVELLLNFC